ncbi:MAG: nitroreductase family protein [Methanoregula sp.]|nr:nitroreductase family protein [Methanoregula sp.]
MCTTDTDQKNAILDEILATRRSYRMFLPVIPPEDDIRRIIHAGLLAPYAAAAVGSSKDYFRRFFVFRNGSRSMAAVQPLVFRQVTAMAAALDHDMVDNPRLRAQAVTFVHRLSMIQKIGTVPGVGTAPYYIVVAEKKGFPPVGQQSLAHCLENMWLKATALELGFQLVSITAQLGDDPAFCGILGIAAGEWELGGCAVGFPKDELSPAIRPAADDVTRWMD